LRRDNNIGKTGILTLDHGASKENSREDFNKSNPSLHSVTGNERNAMLDPSKILTDDYWGLLNNTRDKKDGPDGINIWN
jgi:hypothetical protein